ncbi:MAG TPA: hypothetical protein PLV25_06835, partial [Opitutales bacterium]|nr:hypothetical protein [Opitutales bacterium]
RGWLLEQLCCDMRLLQNPLLNALRAHPFRFAPGGPPNIQSQAIILQEVLAELEQPIADKDYLYLAYTALRYLHSHLFEASTSCSPHRNALQELDRLLNNLTVS